MKTVKEIREAIKTKNLNEFQFQEYIKFFAENFNKLNLGEEIAFKEYARKGAEFLNIHPKDVQDVFNSYRSLK
jgi:hypothetical protein